MKETLREKLYQVQIQMMLESHNPSRLNELQDKFRQLVEEGMRSGELYYHNPNRRSAIYQK